MSVLLISVRLSPSCAGAHLPVLPALPGAGARRPEAREHPGQVVQPLPGQGKCCGRHSTGVGPAPTCTVLLLYTWPWRPCSTHPMPLGSQIVTTKCACVWEDVLLTLPSTPHHPAGYRPGQLLLPVRPPVLVCAGEPGLAGRQQGHFISRAILPLLAGWSQCHFVLYRAWQPLANQPVAPAAVLQSRSYRAPEVILGLAYDHKVRRRVGGVCIPHCERSPTRQ